MKLFIDTEFNSYRGDLISLALVDEEGLSYYSCTHCSNIHPWVQENVIPVLNKPLVSLKKLQNELEEFLAKYETIHIIADWPDDIKYFCAVLLTGPGTRLNTPPLTMEIRRDLDTTSRIPHNALADAQAMRLKYFELFPKTNSGQL